MRRVLALLLVSCLILSTVGCSSGKKDQKEVLVTTKPTATTTVAPTVAPTVEPTVAPTEAPADETGNLIPGGDFEKANSKWGTYTESGGLITTSVNSEQQLEASVSDTGTVNYAAQVYCDGFKLKQNAEYEMSFDISSTVDRSMEWRIQINGGDYHPYVGEKVKITKEMKHYKYKFTMKEASDPAPRLCLNLGYDEKDGELKEHTVYFKNVQLILLDDSKAANADVVVKGPDININQVGYLTSDIKTAIFRDSSKDTNFDVIDVKSGNTVFSGSVTDSVETPGAGETVAYGDFTPLTTPGTYKIVAKNSGKSNQFVIAKNTYDNIFNDSIKMLYLQRCGTKLTEKFAGDFAHDTCHTQKAIIYGTTEKKDVSGGWHDAGDYGRYVVSGAKAVADLLLAYEDYGKKFTDKVGIPESGNGIPDVLDEARYELNWMLKMQDDKSGGVYHKVTGLKFEGTVMPNKVKDDLYIMPISNCATGDFAAVMAMASRVYKEVDSAFAKKCLNASIKALKYMESNNNGNGYINPTNVSTGEYPDKVDADEHFWALCELYKTTGNSSYEDKIWSVDIPMLQDGLGWQAVDLYGCYAYLTANTQNDVLKEKILAKFNDNLKIVENNMNEDGYFSSMGETYPWGSNMSLANNGMLLLMAQKINKNDSSNDIPAKKQLDYLLGANATSYCFVTGYGTLTPKSVHHRPSQSVKKAMKGMLVGGADSNLEDPFAKNVLVNMAPAKCYVDNSQSFSCNEITVYWNSPLIYLLAGVK